MKFVVAQNIKQFKHHYPKAQHDVAYLHDIFQLKGRRNYDIEYVGTWWLLDRDFLKEIEIENNLSKR